MQLQPIKDRILVKRIEEDRREQVVGGIILAPTAYKAPNEGYVVALGEGIRTPENVLVPFAVNIGDRVVFSNTSGRKEPVKFNGEEYLSFTEEDILAVIE